MIKREGQDDFWQPIGAAFPHQNGDGYNVILQALPISDGDGTCKIVLRPPKDDKGDKDADDEEQGKPCGKATTADTAALADTCALSKIRPSTPVAVLPWRDKLYGAAGTPTALFY